jgi:hypothetical protein
MKSHRKLEGDTAKEFLEQLAADKGAILTDEEYDSVRSSQLQTLARPPRIEWAVADRGCSAYASELVCWSQLY